MPDEAHGSMALLGRLIEAERTRNDGLMAQMGQLVSAQSRIDTRLTAIETRLSEALTPGQWIKALAGIGLPLLALWLTGSVDIARQLLPAP